MNPQDGRTTGVKGVRSQLMPQPPIHFNFTKWAKISPKQLRDLRIFTTDKYEQLTPLLGKKFRAKVKRKDLKSIFETAYRKLISGMLAVTTQSQWVIRGMFLIRGLPHAIDVQTLPVRTYRYFSIIGSGRRRFLRARNANSLRLLREVVGNLLYAALAQELAYHGLIPAGSKRRVARLRENRGRPSTAWTVEGHPWRGRNLTPVEVESVEFQFHQIL